MTRRPSLVLLLAGLLAACGCAPDDTASGTGGPAERTARNGEVTLTVRLDSVTAEVGEPLVLSIEAVAPAGVEVTMPEPGDELGPFRVVDRRQPPGVPDELGRRWRHRYELETYESGALELPPVSVEFVDRRDQGDGVGDDSVPAEQTVAIEAIGVTVASVLPEGDGQELRDIRGFVDLPSGRGAWIWSAAIAGIVVIVLSMIWWWSRRLYRGADGSEAPAVVVAPEVWAREALDRLEAERLPQQGAVHEFFFKLSDIVREYIERRFAICAPERTTEEFIREMRDHPVLAEDHQRLLGGFLRSADMVKFALHRPPVDECAHAVETARAFVDETASTRRDAAAGEEVAA